MHRLLLALALLAGAAAAAQPRQNVILYIGDGFGTAPKTATRMALGQGQAGARFSTDPGFQILNLDRMPYTGSVTTHSLNSWVTDSAPGAAVYASGQLGKVDNEYVSFSPTSNTPVETILEQASRAGYAVGLVSTARITHATPAVFASHVWNRDLEDYIAAQYVTTTQADYAALMGAGNRTYDPARDWVLPTPKVGVRLDVALGGGARHFLPSTQSAAGCTASPNAPLRDRTGAPVANPAGTAVALSGRRADCADVVQFARDRGAVYVNSRDALLGLDLTQFTSSNGATLLGLFTNSHVSYEQERQLYAPYEPSLEEMTRIAVEVLSRKSPKGFFLMVESGRIDHMEHGNVGGVRAEAGQLVVEANREAFPADGTATGGGTARIPNVYGSDYMIKEVLQFDYAVGVGRDLVANGAGGRTIILTTSDHECGGFAAVSLNDPSRPTTARTYANEPTRPGAFVPEPSGVTRGGNWFPGYTMAAFQGRMYPQVAPDGRRIVVAYASNPNTNGNGSAVGATPGNHTPTDVWVAAEDNVGGEYARRLSGRGLLDNTDLYPIMRDFLGVAPTASAADAPDAASFGLSAPRPNPSAGRVAFQLTLDRAQPVALEVVDVLGRRVALIQPATPMEAGAHEVRWDGNAAPGQYFLRATADGRVVTQATTVVR